MFRKLYIFSHCGHAVLGPETHRKTVRTSAPAQGRSLSVGFTVPKSSELCCSAATNQPHATSNTKFELSCNDEQSSSDLSHASQAPDTQSYGTVAVRSARSASPAPDPATNNHNRENNLNPQHSNDHLASSSSMSLSRSMSQDTTTIAAASDLPIKTHPFTSRRVESLCPLCEAKRDELLAQWDRTHEVRIECWKWDVGRAVV